MMWLSRLMIAVAVIVTACSARGGRHAQALTIPHPDDARKQVEYFLERPAGNGPWPAVVFVHGHQEWPRPGGQDFVEWGVLDRFAKRGYLAVAVSQPGYGGSTGSADFCGPFTQHAISSVIRKLTADGDVAQNKIVIEGISRGAIVASLVAAHDKSIAGVVLISGLYDLTTFTANSNSAEATLIARSIADETGGGRDEVRARSALHFAGDIKASVLIMNGAQDNRTDPAQARRLADEITYHGGKARAIIYPGYGHHIPLNVRDKEIDPFIEMTLSK